MTLPRPVSTLVHVARAGRRTGQYDGHEVGPPSGMITGERRARSEPDLMVRRRRCACSLRTQQCVDIFCLCHVVCCACLRRCPLGCGWVCFSGFCSLLLCLGTYGEFDPGSGRTLAACFTHASRAVRPFRGYTSGERVSNTWVTCPLLWDKPGKLGLIPDMTTCRMVCGGKLLWWGMGPRPISLLVG